MIPAKFPTTWLAFAVFLSLQLAEVSSITSNTRENLNEIKEVNQKGPYIGLITVYPPEETAFFAAGAFKLHPKHPFMDLSGRRFRIGTIYGKKVVYVRCGVGMTNAAAATQQMLDLFEISGIVHFGIAGSANNSMSIGDVTIPGQWAHTGIWDWLKLNETLPSVDVAELAFERYDVPNEGINLLGHIGFSDEEFYSESNEPNVGQSIFWANASHNWLQLAYKLEGLELEQCVNSSICLDKKPKLVIGLRGSTANIFVDNAAYRDFLFHTFQVSSVDMESFAVLQTSLSNGFPVIVIRGLSDLAGVQQGKNPIEIFGPLAALNAAKVVLKFIQMLQ